jgi:hypothetical protein
MVMIAEEYEMLRRTDPSKERLIGFKNLPLMKCRNMCIKELDGIDQFASFVVAPGLPSASRKAIMLM